MKQHYRTFNMKSEDLKPGDDYGMMKEMLRRRFARLVKEAPRDRPDAVASADGSDGLFVAAVEGVAGEVVRPSAGPAHAAAARLSEVAVADPPARGPRGSGSGPEEDGFPAWPDLVLIDGGKGQLEAARQALAEVGVEEGDVALVGIAKGRDRDAGRETFFRPNQPAFKLPPRDPALYFVQRLRDEAHRFAIGAHRAKRKRELVKSPLDEIAGIGPTRKRALLHHFGTVKAIQRAALEDLMKAPGVNAATARAVYDFFHA
jgi:excinuclease ABC subunit C